MLIALRENFLKKIRNFCSFMNKCHTIQLEKNNDFKGVKSYFSEGVLGNLHFKSEGIEYRED